MKACRIICFSIFCLVALFGTKNANALQSFEGEVVYIKWIELGIKGEDGAVWQFDIGLTTKFQPRRPRPGERVRLRYFDKRGLTQQLVHVAKIVTILADLPEHPLAGELTVGTTAANVRSGPDKDFGVIATAEPGETLILLGQTGKWYKVLLPDHEMKKGWVYDSLVRVNSNFQEKAPKSGVTGNALQPSGKPASF